MLGQERPGILDHGLLLTAHWLDHRRSPCAPAVAPSSPVCSRNERSIRSEPVVWLLSPTANPLARGDKRCDCLIGYAATGGEARRRTLEPRGLSWSIRARAASDERAGRDRNGSVSSLGCRHLSSDITPSACLLSEEAGIGRTVNEPRGDGILKK